MKKLGVLVLALALFWGAGLWKDRKTLENDLIRLHVVANSDSEADQAVKLRVRDAVLENLRDVTAEISDPVQAREALRQRLPRLEQAANLVLEQAGCAERAVVQLRKEAFPRREYDTFRLPAGVYESLRVTIGAGEGHNWWCVVFPQLCLPATSEEFSDVAVSSGFSPELTRTLTGEDGYEIRFYLLDCLGKLENFFVQES